MQSVELTLDAATDAAVRAEWTAVSAAGLPSLADHTGASNRPHVTLAMAEQVPDGVLDPLLDRLPMTLALGGLLVFGTGARRVLVRQVVPTTALLDLHAAVADALAGRLTDAPNLHPGEWSPHVTIARRLDPSGVAAALDALGAPPQPGAATLLRTWDLVHRVVRTFGDDDAEPIR